MTQLCQIWDDSHYIRINASKRCIKFWFRIRKLPMNRYTRLCYDMLKLYDTLGYTNWVTSVRTNLYTNGFGYIWENQTEINDKLFLFEYVQRLKDQYVQSWRTNCENSRKLCTFKDFKVSFMIEPYVTIIDVAKFRKCMALFRCSSHNLMIEKGRHHDIHIEDRNCIYCECVLENEFHFVLVCPLYNDIRLKYIDEFFRNDICYRKFCLLLSCKNESTIRKLAMYLFYAFECRTEFLKGRE